MKKISIDLKNILLLVGISLLIIFVAIGHWGNLIIDCGREVYIPTEILKGKVLYKDIFDIYGPLAYYFNAFLFKLFGVNLNVLYISGSICAISIVSFVYLISRKFLTPMLSFSISLYTISVGLVSFNVFNFVFPYSYAIVYGITLFLASFFCLLKYIENDDDTKFLYLSALFAGMCFVTKYEFFLYFLILIFAIFYVRKLKLQQILISFICLFAFPVAIVLTFKFSGVSLHDLAKMFILICHLGKSKTLAYFYKSVGTYFYRKTPIFVLVSFLKMTLIFGLFYFGCKSKKFWISFVCFFVSLMFLVYFLSIRMLLFLPVFSLILGLIFYKNLIADKKLFVLFLSATVLSLKSFWGLLTLNYGIYFVSILLVCVISVLYSKYSRSQILFKAVAYFLIILAFFTSYFNFYKTYFSVPLETEKGTIFSVKSIVVTSRQLIDYLKEKSTPSDTVVIYPEGLMINFLSERKSDDFYPSLIPIYIEMYGKDNIIEHFSKTKPKFIIFNNWSTKDYYFKTICNNYAIGFCTYVRQNYNLKKTFEFGDFQYKVFELR